MYLEDNVKNDSIGFKKGCFSLSKSCLEWKDIFICVKTVGFAFKKWFRAANCCFMLKKICLNMIAFQTCKKFVFRWKVLFCAETMMFWSWKSAYVVKTLVCSQKTNFRSKCDVSKRVFVEKVIFGTVKGCFVMKKKCFWMGK